MSGESDYPTVVKSSSAVAGKRAHHVLKALAPRNVVNGRKRRVGAAGDGGYVMLDAFDGNEPIYSFGVGGDVSWDRKFAEDGHTVYLYDHTVPGPPADHPRFIFQPRAIDTGSGSIPVLIQENGHEGRQDLILSIDIEGDEHKVIPTCPPDNLAQFKQIVMELHGLTRIVDDQGFKTIDATISALLKAHQVIHVHANNWGWYGLLGGVPIPDTLELTLVRRADFVFEECRDDFPTELDLPCNPAVPDYFLGRLGMA